MNTSTKKVVKVWLELLVTAVLRSRVVACCESQVAFLAPAKGRSACRALGSFFVNSQCCNLRNAFSMYGFSFRRASMSPTPREVKWSDREYQHVVRVVSACCRGYVRSRCGFRSTLGPAFARLQVHCVRRYQLSEWLGLDCDQTQNCSGDGPSSTPGTVSSSPRETVACRGSPLPSGRQVARST